MWLEEVSLDNIKCFDKVNLRLGSKDAPYPWVTLLGENGGGKSTILQALGLLLAGPEGSQFSHRSCKINLGWFLVPGF